MIEPLLPVHEPGEALGRPWCDDRAALNVILFALLTGCQWAAIPRSLFPVSGSAAWRRLREWQEAGVWNQRLDILLNRLNGADKIDWSCAAMDSGSVAAKRGGELTGPNPTDRSHTGSKHHVIADRRGTPLASPMLTAANRTNSPTLPAVLDRVRPVRGRRGRPRRRPRKLLTDKCCSRANKLACHRQRIIPHLARKGIESKTHLGRYRWVVERTLVRLHRYRRLVVRYERLAMMHQAFLTLAVCLICWNVIKPGL